MQRALGVKPSDSALQRQARIIIYEFDDEWNQTAADNVDWLNAFKERNFPSAGAAAAAVDRTVPLNHSLRDEAQVSYSAAARKLRVLRSTAFQLETAV